jgi:hypothetical protein
MKIDVLLIAASWEDRFILGLQKNIQKYEPSTVIMIQYNPNLNWKKTNIQKARQLLGVNLIEIKIDSTRPSDNWRLLNSTFAEHCVSKHVLIDISTMTRETIWNCFYYCKQFKCKTDYIYYSPEYYSSEWISRDPGKPRLLYKMSGISKLGIPSLLIITGGFDIQRLDSLIYHFEPKKTLLFFQKGDDLRNKENVTSSKIFLSQKYKVDMPFEYDPYDIDGAYNVIFTLLNEKKTSAGLPLLDNYNIILNSLGVKTSAVILFKIWLKFPQVALSYIPSKEYNKDYSSGIGKDYTGQLFR